MAAALLALLLLLRTLAAAAAMPALRLAVTSGVPTTRRWPLAVCCRMLLSLLPLLLLCLLWQEDEMPGRHGGVDCDAQVPQLVLNRRQRSGRRRVAALRSLSSRGGCCCTRRRRRSCCFELRLHGCCLFGPARHLALFEDNLAPCRQGAGNNGGQQAERGASGRHWWDSCWQQRRQQHAYRCAAAARRRQQPAAAAGSVRQRTQQVEADRHALAPRLLRLGHVSLTLLQHSTLLV